MREEAKKIYLKLEDWILVAVKSESDAVIEMEDAIKTKIEEE